MENKSQVQETSVMVSEMYRDFASEFVEQFGEPDTRNISQDRVLAFIIFQVGSLMIHKWSSDHVIDLGVGDSECGD